MNPVETPVSRLAGLAKPSSGHLRADAVSLEVAVKVHGSRVTDVARGVAPRTEPFEEETTTMIVFPQGGVVRMSTSVSSGQMLVLTNLKSRQDAICRVVKVRTFTNMQGYVEVEFTHPQPGYWGVYFPSDAPGSQGKAAAPSSATPAPAEVKEEKATPDISWAPPPAPPQPPVSTAPDTTPAAREFKPAAPAPFLPPVKPASSFVSIGSQEDVQPAASATVTMKPLSSSEVREAPTAPPQPPKAHALIDFPSAPPAPPASISMTELLGDDGSATPSHSAADAIVTAGEEEESTASAAPHSEAVRHTFGSFAGGATLDSSKAPSSEAFTDGSEEGAAAKRSWLPVAAGVALLLSCALGGVFYFRRHSAGAEGAASANVGSAASASAPAPAPAPVPSASAETAAVRPSRPQPGAAPAPAAKGPSASSSEPAASVVAAPPISVSSSPSKAAVVLPSAPAKPPAPVVTSNILASSLSAHPTASRRGGNQAVAEPSIDAVPAPASDAALPGILGSSDATPPPPEVKAEAPVKVGGEVTPPQLISRALPLYPTVAKEANVSGDVAVRATIDAKGNVSHMEIVSGPPMLRQAALEALHRWKYRPATLDGQPVETQILVTIQFHR